MPQSFENGRSVLQKTSFIISEAAAKRKKQKKNVTAAGIFVKALGTAIRTIAAILVTILAAIGVVTLIYPELRDTFLLIVKQTLMGAGFGSGG